MSEELLRTLRCLEEEYMEQPPIVQRADLEEINQLRSQLGLPLVDARLKPMSTIVETSSTETKPTRHEAKTTGDEETPPKPTEDGPDHAEARQIYQSYLEKTEKLAPHRDYALRVAKATAGGSQTPVRPLATMGTSGGPLLCDVCRKPFLLEGGRCHRMTAAAAWRRNSATDWNSFILGGMVVELQTNGTIRVYHGYSGRNESDCCNVASRMIDAAREAFDSSRQAGKWPLILAFLEQEFPEMDVEDRCKLLNAVLFTVFAYDPGIGVNRPAENDRLHD